MVEAGGPRVVLSAANPGAAFLIKVALETLAAHQKIIVAGVIVQSPANDQLGPICAYLGIPCMTLNAPRYDPPHKVAQAEMLDALERLVEPLAPDAVLIGLSGPDIGVDEALAYLAQSRGWLAYSMQDASGWVVRGISGPTPTYFVQDAAHVSQTESAEGVTRAVPIGTLKLLSFSDISRAHAAAENRRSGVIFFGQPLWHLTGYVMSLTALAEAINSAGLGPFFYRPHPLEDSRALASLNNADIIPDDSPSYEDALMNFDMVASCYSTALQDAAQLAALTGRTCPKLVYCLEEADIRDAFVTASQPLEKTLKEQPYAHFFLKTPMPDDLKSIFKSEALSGINFPPPQPERIPATIFEDWAASRFLPQSYAANTGLSHNQKPNEIENKSNLDTIPGLAKFFDAFDQPCSPLKQVIPPQGGNYYLRTELENKGAIFLKTIDTEQAARLGAAMQIETVVAKTCSHVIAPLLSAPVPLDGSKKSVVVWPWVESRSFDPTSPKDLRGAGIALGRLHHALAKIDLPTDHARARVEWLLQGWKNLNCEMEARSLDAFSARFPWLNKAIEDVSRGISEALLNAPRQMIHGDLNPGNLLTCAGPKIIFIDFEEAVQSYLPTFFDLAMLIERQLMIKQFPGSWQSGASLLVEAYISETGTRLPYASCLFDALCFSILRSLTVLVVSERAGKPWPDSEWAKFDHLTRNVMAQEESMFEFAEAYL